MSFEYTFGWFWSAKTCLNEKIISPKTFFFHTFLVCSVDGLAEHLGVAVLLEMERQIERCQTWNNLYVFCSKHWKTNKFRPSFQNLSKNLINLASFKIKNNLCTDAVHSKDISASFQKIFKNLQIAPENARCMKQRRFVPAHLPRVHGGHFR